ncbi:MAG TPA: hypothetical protein VK623_04060 [Flavobacterium sp.]|nr:hypothetical protein [Flavobacterium sp.]
MKNIITILIILITNIALGQTFNETKDWISSNTKGSEQVLFLKEDNQIYFLSVRQAGTLLTTFSNNFDPRAVVSISSVKDENNKYSIKLKFKEGGTIVTKLMLDKNKNPVGSVDKINMLGWKIYVEADKEMISRFKKAYIHLFKELGIQLKDGDIF